MVRKRVKPAEDDPLEAGGEHPANEVIMRVDRHFILVVLKMLDGVGRSGVEVEARHHELPRETVSHDFLREWELKIFRLHEST